MHKYSSYALSASVVIIYHLFCLFIIHTFQLIYLVGRKYSNTQIWSFVARCPFIHALAHARSRAHWFNFNLELEFGVDWPPSPPRHLDRSYICPFAKWKLIYVIVISVEKIIPINIHIRRNTQANCCDAVLQKIVEATTTLKKCGFCLMRISFSAADTHTHNLGEKIVSREKGMVWSAW